MRTLAHVALLSWRWQKAIRQLARAACEAGTSVAKFAAVAKLLELEED
ncbi:hypothetical protein LCGC14_1184780 [marine sediment metagenome]|uniref:Uncharacterized protein n=1 Tax=marine sediment metagenome TaxID=412755 RepID=A0A0F9PRP3_9ZZZZ